MTIQPAATIEQVAAVVAAALRSAGIDAVLVGGASAALHSGGAYHSDDLDFVLRSRVRPKQLDQVMERIGFRRRGNQYVHDATSFFVEFPAGPLGIGADLGVRPVLFMVGSIEIATLSPTDSCRDRLAAFFHWSDRQSLMAAVAIAAHGGVDLARVKKWSETEGHRAGFDEFVAELKSQRSSRSPPAGLRPAAPPA